MDKVILFSSGCPKCNVIIKKLKAAGIEYEEKTSIEDMQAIGITTLPQLSVGGVLYSFGDAIRWIDKNKKE